MGFFNSLMSKPSNSIDLSAKIQSGVTVVDVRSKAEFNDGHHAKATNIPLDTLHARIDEIGPKDKGIIVYCASGARSAMAARMLKAAGFMDVINAGGLADMPR
ncbi:MAG: rhodanese-like domain-containing protein [Gallionellaceae bacterium]|jgi:phage shock protein E